jgi:hypothetical protein
MSKIIVLLKEKQNLLRGAVPGDWRLGRLADASLPRSQQVRCQKIIFLLEEKQNLLRGAVPGGRETETRGRFAAAPVRDEVAKIIFS